MEYLQKVTKSMRESIMDPKLSALTVQRLVHMYTSPTSNMDTIFLSLEVLHSLSRSHGKEHHAAIAIPSVMSTTAALMKMESYGPDKYAFLSVRAAHMVYNLIRSEPEAITMVYKAQVLESIVWRLTVCQAFEYPWLIQACELPPSMKYSSEKLTHALIESAYNIQKSCMGLGCNEWSLIRRLLEEPDNVLYNVVPTLPAYIVSILKTMPKNDELGRKLRILMLKVLCAYTAYDHITPCRTVAQSGFVDTFARLYLCSPKSSSELRSTMLSIIHNCVTESGSMPMKSECELRRIVHDVATSDANARIRADAVETLACIDDLLCTGSSSSSSSSSMASPIPAPSTCSICHDKQSSGVFVPCGHVCCCLVCASLLSTPMQCPMCRASASSFMRLYM